MQAYSIKVTPCRGQQPSVYVHCFASVADAFEFAFARWPRAVAVGVQPLCKGCGRAAP